MALAHALSALASNSWAHLRRRQGHDHKHLLRGGVLGIGSNILDGDRVFGRVFAAFRCGHLQSLAQGMDPPSGLGMIRSIVTAEQSTLALGDYAACDVHSGRPRTYRRVV